MKNIFSIFLLTISASAFSQVIIGDNIGTAVNKTSVLLDFAANQNKGIILPYVKTISSTPAEGTIILDASDATKARVLYYNASPGWVDLSNGDRADITSTMASQTLLDGFAAKTVIGARSSAADGVLVLESTTKAMVLPIVSDTNDIMSPAPGMMVFINKAGAKRLAVFNGANWTYWKP